MPTLAIHCLVKNEENFIKPAIMSAIDFADKVFVFDTGSTDRTASIIKELAAAYPDKIVFEEKGECDRVRHTALRQEMIERTAADWFMILDGDEVWTKKAMIEAKSAMETAAGNGITCLVSPFYLCVGDIYHQARRRGQFDILGKLGCHTPRFIKRDGVCWQGDYNEDTLVDTATGQALCQRENSAFLKEKFWHLTHLRRSSEDDAVYSSGNCRAAKRRETYFLIGKRICESPPEDLLGGEGARRLPLIESVINLFRLALAKLVK